MTAADFREFIREQTLRHERATQSMERWLQSVDRRVDEMVERTQQIVRRTDEVIEEQRAQRSDLREESRAHREALFAVLDRLNQGPATSG